MKTVADIKAELERRITALQAIKKTLADNDMAVQWEIEALLQCYNSMLKYVNS